MVHVPSSGAFPLWDALIKYSNGGCPGFAPGSLLLLLGRMTPTVRTVSFAIQFAVIVACFAESVKAAILLFCPGLEDHGDQRAEEDRGGDPGSGVR